MKQIYIPRENVYCVSGSFTNIIYTAAFSLQGMAKKTIYETNEIQELKDIGRIKLFFENCDFVPYLSVLTCFGWSKAIYVLVENFHLCTLNWIEA